MGWLDVKELPPAGGCKPARHMLRLEAHGVPMGTLIVQLQGEYESFPAPSAAGDKEEEDWYVCWHGCKCSQNRKDRCWIDSLLPTHPDRAVCWATFLLHCSRSHALMPKTQSIHPTQTLTAKPVCAHCWRSFLVFAWSGDCPAPFWLYSA